MYTPNITFVANGRETTAEKALIAAEVDYQLYAPATVAQGKAPVSYDDAMAYVYDALESSGVPSVIESRLTQDELDKLVEEYEKNNPTKDWSRETAATVRGLDFGEDE